MSATGVSIISKDYAADLDSAPRRERWWERFAKRCAAPACPNRGKLWPAWLRRPAGVLFEGRCYCEPECLRPALEFRVLRLLSSFAAQKTRTHRVPLGLLLVNRGVLSPERLREALRLQQDAGGGRLGDWFRHLGAVSEQQLTAALGQQWGCPVFPLEQQRAHPSWSGLVPVPLLASARAVPAYASADRRVLHLCFGERVDHTLLYAIEHILRCRTVTCVAPETTIAEFLGELRRRAERAETCFDTIRDPGEMTRIICNYASELQAEDFAVARASAHIWVRFYGKNTRDLLFRVSPDSTPASPVEQIPGRAKAFSGRADNRKDGVADATGPL